MHFGVHVSIAGGVDRAPERATALGCDCFHLFVTNPRSWALPQLDGGVVARFRERRTALGLAPVIVHLTYLPNCASPEPTLWRKSLRHLQAQYAAAAALGVELFVMHPGSHRGAGLAAGIGRLARALDQTLDATPEGPRLLLENTAGGGDTIGRNPAELGAVLAGVRQRERLGLCLDTCHAWAMGAALHRRGGWQRLITAHERACGAGAVRLIHANDSRAPRGGGQDRHWHIGRGTIGEAGFAHLLRARGARQLPWILETPVNDERGDADNLAAIRCLAP